LESNKATELVDIQKKIDELTVLYQEQHKYEVMEKDYKEQISELKQVYTEAQYKHHDAMNF
jgi:low affinity Fe/Cu permease